MPSTLMTSTSWKPASASCARFGLRQLIAGFDINLARLDIDHVARVVAAEQVVVADDDRLDAFFLPLAQRAHGDLLTGFGQRLAGLGILPLGLALALRIHTGSSGVVQWPSFVRLKAIFV